jgi:heat shock protein beta
VHWQNSSLQFPHLLFLLFVTEDSTEEEIVEDEEDEGKKPNTKTIKETKWDWELLNSVKAIWLRNPKDVTPEEYDKFYHSLAKVFWFVKSS